MRREILCQPQSSRERIIRSDGVRWPFDQKIEKNLVAYERAATATANHGLTVSAPLLAVGLSMFALSQVSFAEVVCTPVTETVHGSHGRLNFDLNNDGIEDASVHASSTFILGSGGNFFRSQGLGARGLIAGNGILANKQTEALALRGGQEFGPADHFAYSASMARHFSNLSSHSTRGQWQDVKNRRFLGVKFLISGETHFGWISFSSSAVTGPQATVTGYAYETEANKPITAGMCSEGATSSETAMEAVPGSLGRLAVGAAGR